MRLCDKLTPRFPFSPLLRVKLHLQTPASRKKDNSTTEYDNVIDYFDGLISAFVFLYPPALPWPASCSSSASLTSPQDLPWRLLHSDGTSMSS